MYKECTFKNPDGLTQYYRDYDNAGADAPVILCMPGLTRNSNDFKYIAEHLQRRFRIVCVEQRGRGRSEWDPQPERYMPQVYVGDMFALIAQLGLTELNLLGTSLGGLMSTMMQAMKPAGVTFNTIVLNDIGAELDPVGLKRISSYVGKVEPITTWEGAISRTKDMNTGVFPNFSDEEWDMFTRQLFIEKDGELVADYDPALRENFEGNPEESAPTLWPIFDQMKDVPTLVIRGGISDILAADVLAKMCETLPNVEGATIPGVGHAPLLNEKESQDAISTFYFKHLGV